MDTLELHAVGSFVLVLVLLILEYRQMRRLQYIISKNGIALNRKSLKGYIQTSSDTEFRHQYRLYRIFIFLRYGVTLQPKIRI
jgi:hypothetical protein